MELKTTVYGLVDVARSLYMTVKEDLLKLGAKMSKFDEALFIWRSEEELHSLIGCHVGDFIYCGSVLFKQHWSLIKQESQLGIESVGYIGKDSNNNRSK